MSAGTAGAATLTEALQQWTGVTADVVGRGAQVMVSLPPTSLVPAFSANAVPTTRAGDPGWQLTSVALPQPTRLSNGATLTIMDQHGQAFLGARTVSVDAQEGGVAIAQGGQTTRLDHAAIVIDATGGPVALSVDLAGIHLDHAPPGSAALLPSHVSLHGHTTPAGAAALNAMARGRPGGAAPLTIDASSVVIGPARFSAIGTVTIVSPNDRRGELTVTAEHFKDLLRQMQASGAAAQAYPVLMILRSFGRKEAGHLSWTVIFAGPQVMVDGIDIAPLLGQ